MPPAPQDPTQPPGPEQIARAREALAQARHAGLAFLRPDGTGRPGISRIALGLGPEGGLLSLVSDLTQHAPGLRANPDCALLVGEVGAKGDPLTHPRLMIEARAEFVTRSDPAHGQLRAHWLHLHPKAALYIDFADFHLLRLWPLAGLLNEGFGRAYRLGAADLILPR